MNKQSLDELIRAEKRAYSKNWRTKNADKVKKHNDNYWRKRALQKLQSEVKQNKAGD